jgi:predicted flap endonuclease-1-like 5' DNA nuclease
MADPEAPQQVPRHLPLVGDAAPVGATTQALAEDPYVTISALQRQLSELQTDNTVLRTQLVTLQEGELRAREQVVALTQKAMELESRLTQQGARAGREPDDFASAVSHSLDTLQARLAGLSNPLTDFAVREFSIDARVAVNVTPLGTVEYRFIRPGDTVSPMAVSNVSMKVVPVPKQTQAGTWTPVEFTPSAAVEEIRGIGRQLRQQLNLNGIYTVGDLLHAGGRVRGSVELAHLLSVDRYRVDEWLAHAQLLTIRDVTGRIAGVLYEIGVRTLADLAARDPAELAPAFNAQVLRTGRKRVAEVTVATVTPWVRAARSYLGLQQQAAAG